MNLDEETWVSIVDFPNYQVSNLGNIKKDYTIGVSKWGSPLKLKAKAMALSTDTAGYLYVSLTNRFGRFKPKVHRLVAKAFIENTENKKEVNHINSNRKDNRLANLEWCTPKENVHHSLKQGRWAHRSKLATEDVVNIRMLFKDTKMRISDLSKIYNVHEMTISGIVKNKRRVILHK